MKQKTQYELEVDDLLNQAGNIKKRKNSKRKGNRKELEICKKLTNHFKLNFNRVPNSGAFGSTHKLSKNAQDVLMGDIICPPNFKFVIENKCGYDIDIINLFSNKNNTDTNTIIKFIEQSCKDSRVSNKIPLLIYSKDYREPICFVPVDYICKYIDKFNLYLCLNFESETIKPYTKWYVISFEELLNKLDIDFFFKKENE